MCGYLIFQISYGFYSLKFSDSKNQFFEKNQNQRTAGSIYFRNIKELTVFMKVLSKEPSV